jgi:SAM-dependent methyltransferase
MDAEALDFPDNSVDLVCGVAILHHLDLAKSVGGIARILKPTGTAIFLEPLAHNPLINLYRRLTPQLRTEDEHPLTMTDLRSFEDLFERVETRYFHLLSLSMAPCYWLPGHEKLVRILDTSDRILFQMAPFLRRYAWTAGLIFSKPRRSAAVAGSAATAMNGVAGAAGRRSL